MRYSVSPSKKWSGIFQLRAEGGFLVAAAFADGSVLFAEVRSLFGNKCVIENPWRTTCVVRERKSILVQSDETSIRFQTRTGGTYIIENPDNPISKSNPMPIEDHPNQLEGMPGRICDN